MSALDQANSFRTHYKIISICIFALYCALALQSTDTLYNHAIRVYYYNVQRNQIIADYINQTQA